MSDLMPAHMRHYCLAARCVDTATCRVSEHKDPRLLDHYDMFRYVTRQKEPPAAVIRNKWFRSYVDKLWVRPDLATPVHDEYLPPTNKSL